ADEMRLERRARRGRLQLLEAVRQRQRCRVEDRELLLDSDGEVGGRLVLLSCEADLLLGGKALGITHGRTTLVEALRQLPGRALRAPTSLLDTTRGLSLACPFRTRPGDC